MNNVLNRVCVFCGSNKGNSPIYLKKANELGKILSENNLTLVYGGSNIGLMGELSRSTLANNGKAIGVIPKKIYDMVDNNIPLTELHIVDNMHDRKSMMYELSDGFIIFPGGIGTIEEFFEIFTWYQLGYHLKPICILNIENYFDFLIQFLIHMVSEGFFKKKHLDNLIIEENPTKIIQIMKNHEVEFIHKLK